MTSFETDVESTGVDLTVFGVVTIMLGVAAIAAPIITGLSIVLSVGLLVVVAGFLRMLWAFEDGSFGTGVLAFVLGGLTLLCGGVLVIEPLFASGLLTVVIAAYLVADGVAEIVAAFRLPREAGRPWLLFAGVASILLGAMIWSQFPLSGAWAIGVLLGIKLLLVGTVIITAGYAARSLA